jgi:hypothetical protein
MGEAFNINTLQQKLQAPTKRRLVSLSEVLPD